MFSSVGQLLLFGPIRNILSLLDGLFWEEQIEDFFVSTIGQIYIDTIAFIFSSITYPKGKVKKNIFQKGGRWVTPKFTFI